jgi:2-polyprenyl-6-methoxyphenol hydroxylase-like FAD-dependent oxidoreductase
MINSAGAHRAHNILISGAGTAGQSLAYWLHRHGFRPTVVERAPAPRSGGFAIDLRGSAIPVAEHMGILDDLRRVRVRMREILHLDRHGEVVWKTDGNFGGGEGLTGDVEILREDLNNIMQVATDPDVEYIFSDSITGITDDGDGVEVTFEHERPRRFDLVIGGDGLHSVVRSLVFGPERQFARPLGYYVAISTIPNLFDMDREWWMYDMPGKMTNVMQYGHDKHTRGMFIFASPPLDYDRGDLTQQKSIIERAFADEKSWKIPALLDAMRDSTDLYFDDVTQIHMPHWSNGRVALLGDAGYAPTLITGQGTSLAVVGAYVLAGELKTAGGDHRIAFDRYEHVIRSYVEQNQRIAGCGELSLPNTWEELEQKNARMREIYDTPDGDPAEDSAGVLIQTAANAIDLNNYVHP